MKRGNRKGPVRVRWEAPYDVDEMVQRLSGVRLVSNPLASVLPMGPTVFRSAEGEAPYRVKIHDIAGRNPVASISGVVDTMATGSSFDGELRLAWLIRHGLYVWLGGLAAIGLVALLAVVQNGGISPRVSGGLINCAIVAFVFTVCVGIYRARSKSSFRRIIAQVNRRLDVEGVQVIDESPG